MLRARGASLGRDLSITRKNQNIVILSGARFACLPQAGAAKDLNSKFVVGIDVEILRLSPAETTGVHKPDLVG